jgi:predicted DNA-binding antitoxin AbrB/MazE fold protein
MPHRHPDGFGDNGVMTKTLQAVYENGVLRPLEPLPLKEHERVMVTVSDPIERWLDHEYTEKVKRDVAAMGPAPSLEEVRKALSKIPGKLSDDIRAKREGR